MFKKKFIIIAFAIVALGLGLGTFYLRSNQKETVQRVKAGSVVANISTQAEWDTGLKDNVLTTNGEVTINDKSLVYTDIAGNLLSSFIEYLYPDGTIDESFDLGQIFTHVSRVWFSAAGPAGSLYFSNDNLNWEFVRMLDQQWIDLDFDPRDVRYVRIADTCSYGCSTPPCYCVIDTLKLYRSSGYGTIISQIDGGENFWEWETNVVDESVPANTSTSYRYRTSTNGTDWTAWVGDIGSVTSRTGDDSNDPTKYRYLQIEATLSNTDGASTPTIYSYSIGYHTNQKPNAPTAMTAVIN